MSKVVYRGIQSCIEPQIHEKTTLRLKLISPNSIDKNRGASVLDSPHMELEDKITPIKAATTEFSTNLEKGCWNFLPSFTNSPKIQEKTMGVESAYVDPYKPSSFSRLSEKSLEICTENLGSETGSDTMDSSIFSMDLENNKSYASERKSTKLNTVSRKETSCSFPPPLTSISGSNHVLVRSHCEDGRLIIKAVESTPSNTCFHVERNHGRLRLSFLKNNVDSELHNEDDEIVEIENGESEAGGGEDEEENDGYMKKGMDGNSCEGEGRMGITESFQRPSRCKEDGHGGNKKLYNWEAFWVAT